MSEEIIYNKRVPYYDTDEDSKKDTKPDESVLFSTGNVDKKAPEDKAKDMPADKEKNTKKTIKFIAEDIIDKSSKKDTSYRMYEKSDKESEEDKEEEPIKEKVFWGGKYRYTRTKPRSSTTTRTKSTTRKEKPQPNCSLQAWQLNNIFFASYAALAGTQEALPEDSERAELDEALEMYLIENKAQFSPGFVLTMTYLGFVMKSMNKPAVKKSLLARLAQLLKKIRDVIFRRKNKNFVKNVTNLNQKEA